VIGVVGDMRRHGLERESSGHIYEWSKQSGERTPDLVVRTSVEPASATDALRSAIRETSSVAIIGRVATLESQLNEQTTPQRFRTWLLSLFAALGVVLATVGLYGVMHDSVVRRTREIGIRRALGAQAVGILITILGNGLKLALLGLATGLVASWWVAQLLSNLLYGVTPTDPSTFVGAVLLLTVVATAASLAPALRATRVDPMVALRHE
jgi:ABC-type antimicrobial peptide transport system permease subunit